jgi:hypothetical protein
MIRRFAITALIGLTACTPMAKPEQHAGLGGCGDAKVAGLVGKVWTESLRAGTLKTSRAAALRIIAPGTIVTMDFRPDRLNIETDNQGRVTRLRCG